MKRTAVIDVVGLTAGLIGAHTPRIRDFVQRTAIRKIEPPFPAVTCTAQANFLTGSFPSSHGIVGNGWYDRDLAEVHFWKQSNHLVQSEKVWEKLRRRDPSFTCAKLFWWYNMYSSADFSITPRPLYPADGRKVFDIYTSPLTLRPEIKAELGEFPFPTFWGPAAGVEGKTFSADAATRWIAESAKWIERRYRPTLSLVYLPHLDYNLQRVGPSHLSIHDDLMAIDRIVGELIEYYESFGVEPLLVSEYGITEVQNPIHLNRLFREQGWAAIKDELGLEILDCGASHVFAIADHQIAHVYVNNKKLLKEVTDFLVNTPGVEVVLGNEEKVAHGLSHSRAGDLVAVASSGSWFTYYYWKNDAQAPDFARTVDIHRKPGYDPVELFLDPDLSWPKLKIASRLLQKKLGFRMLLDVIPLRADLVRGSHGRMEKDRSCWPILVGKIPHEVDSENVLSTDIVQTIESVVFGK